MPDFDHQIMTCPECLTEFQIEDSDPSDGEPSCPVCGTMTDAVEKTSLTENHGNSMPLPVPRKLLNLELPEMIIQNANQKIHGDKIQHPPAAKLKNIRSAPSPQPATSRKFAIPPIKWESSNGQEGAPQSASDAIDPDVKIRIVRVSRQHKYSARPWIYFLLIAALLMITTLTILPRLGRKKSDAADPLNKQPDQTISKVQKPVQEQALPVQAPSTTSPIQQAIKKHGIRGTHEKASASVRYFLEATTLDERKIFSRSLQRVEPLMIEYYETHDPGPIKYDSLSSQHDSVPLKDYYLIGVTLDDLSTAYAIVTIEQDRFLVDWESFVGYSEMSLDKFMEEQPNSPTLFRLRVKPDDYYNFNFTAEDYQCLHLSDRNQTTVIYGYLLKGAGPISSLQPGQEEFFTLHLRYPETSKTANQVIIDKVITSGWIIE